MASLENRIKYAFCAFDRDGDGLINEGEAICCIRGCGFYLSNEEEATFIKALGANGGLVQFENLKKVILATLQGRDAEKDLLQHFKKFDRMNDGTIKSKELEEILHTIGDLLSEPEVQSLCSLVKKGNLIPYKELVQTLLADKS